MREYVSPSMDIAFQSFVENQPHLAGATQSAQAITICQIVIVCPTRLIKMVGLRITDLQVASPFCKLFSFILRIALDSLSQPRITLFPLGPSVSEKLQLNKRSKTKEQQKPSGARLHAANAVLSLQIVVMVRSKPAEAGAGQSLQYALVCSAITPHKKNITLQIIST